MNLALKSALTNFTIRGSELFLGDVALSELARKHGTPVYVYSEEIIRKKHQALRKALPDNLQIYYAVKANPNQKILRIMGSLYHGFDVASAGELRRVIDAGITSEKISFAGPGKTLSELHYAVEHGIVISVESEQEFGHIKSISAHLGKTANVAVRVNPDFDLSQSGMKMGGGPKQFGVDSERVPALIKAMAGAETVRFKGIHVFAGSQNLNADVLLQTFEKILEYAVSLTRETGIPLRQVNMGGGLGIPYFAHESPLDLTALGAGLEELLSKYTPLLGSPKFIMELGRFLVGECGIYLARILYRKMSMGQVFLIADGGMHHHIAATGNFGQSLVRRPMPITVANRQGGALEKTHVVGPLCTPLDTFGYVELPESREGDIVAVLQSGAYGFSASPHLFLSHPAPKEIIISS